MSASEWQDLAQFTVTLLQKIHIDDAYEDFWNKLDSTLDIVDVSEPAWPRRRKAPKGFDTSSASYEYPQIPKDMYRKTFYEAFDLVINCIQNSFDQPGFRVYKNVQYLLMCCVTGNSATTEERNFLFTFYKDDLDKTTLLAKKESLKTLAYARYTDVSMFKYSRPNIKMLLTFPAKKRFYPSRYLSPVVMYIFFN